MINETINKYEDRQCLHNSDNDGKIPAKVNTAVELIESQLKKVNEKLALIQNTRVNTSDTMITEMNREFNTLAHLVSLL